MKTSKQETKGWIAAGYPDLFPTHCHSHEFWEWLGRAVATFGQLEWVLAQAIFALTGIQQYPSQDELMKAYDEWPKKLEKALKDTLWPLAEDFVKAANKHQVKIDCIDEEELVDDIKAAAHTRNVLCHGAWKVPDKDKKSLPIFVNKNLEVWDAPIDVDFLKKTQAHVAELIRLVISSVTTRGIQFPGSGGPGKQVWP